MCLFVGQQVTDELVLCVCVLGGHTINCHIYSYHLDPPFFPWLGWAGEGQENYNPTGSFWSNARRPSLKSDLVRLFLCPASTYCIPTIYIALTGLTRDTLLSGLEHAPQRLLLLDFIGSLTEVQNNYPSQPPPHRASRLPFPSL